MPTAAVWRCTGKPSSASWTSRACPTPTNCPTARGRRDPDPFWHADEAARLARQGQWFAAAVHHHRLREHHPDYADAYHRALCEAAAGQGGATVSPVVSCSGSCRAVPTSSAGRGWSPPLPAACRRLVAAVAAVTVTDAERSLWLRTLLLLPGAVPDPSRPAAAGPRVRRSDPRRRPVPGWAVRGSGEGTGGPHGTGCGCSTWRLSEQGRGQTTAARQAADAGRAPCSTGPGPRPGCRGKNGWKRNC